MGGLVINIVLDDARKLSAQVTKIFEGGTLSYTEYKILRSLRKKDAVMAKPLAKDVGQSVSGLTRFLEQLETKGYLERHAHPSDRRSVLVVLTLKGAELIERMMPEIEKRLYDMENRLTEEEAQGLAHYLEKLTIASET